MYTLLDAVVGSKAYGLDTPDSDEDRLGVYLVPTTDILALSYSRYKETYTNTSPDWTMHELNKFCRLAIKCNPSIIELFFLEEYIIRNPIIEPFLDANMFLSTKAVINAYGGYAKSQINKYKSQTGRFNDKTKAKKNVRHTYRLICQGIDLLLTGKMQVRLSDYRKSICHKAEAMCIDDQEYFLKIFEQWDQEFKLAAAKSCLPDAPAIDKINTELNHIRHKYFWEIL